MTWFEILFKYPLSLYRESRLVFTGQIPADILFLLLIICAVGMWYLYRKTAARLSATRRRILLTLRIAAMVLILIMLSVPALRQDRPRDSVFTAVLVDMSRSMSIADADMPKDGKVRRIDAASRILFGGHDGGKSLFHRLGKNTILYGFDSELHRLSGPDQIKANGHQSNLFKAVRDLDAELKGMPLAAVLMVTDGCRNTGGTGEEASRLLKNRGVPLHIIGLGNAQPPKDYEVSAVFAPRRVRRNTQVEAFATLRYTDYETKPFEVKVSRGDATLLTRKIEPDRDTDIKRIKLDFTPDFEGSATYKVSIPADAGESITNNNSKEFVMDMRDDRLPVLYIEGSPRLEYRFLRRALHRDRDFRLVGALRLASNRFYIQGANSNEQYLAQGFPKTRDQLYSFEAIILGDIEASYFTADQLAMIEEFVNTRGGGLMMLGGVNSFGLGKYQDTPVARLLPFQVTGRDGNYSDEQFKPAFSKASLRHPVMRLADDSVVNMKIWEKIPELIGITPVQGLKPGAQLLISSEKNGKPVMAVQNYGSGRVAAFTSGGSWYWRVSVPSTDEFHEKFWKQLIRWLAIGAKQQISLESEADVYSRGDKATLRAFILRKDLTPANDVNATITLTDPLGNVQEVPMQWILSQEGVYQCTVMAEEQGDYRAVLKIEGWDIPPVETDFKVSEPYIEFSNSGLKEEMLKSMAQNTGGRYFAAGDADQAPEEIGRNMQTASIAGIQPDDHEIWDMPLIFALLVMLLSAEWVIRRQSGLA